MTPTIIDYGMEVEVEIPLKKGRTIISSGATEQEALRKAVNVLSDYILTLEDEIARVEAAAAKAGAA
jgi:hypothetical protein